MTSEEREKVNDLIRRIQEEQDPKKFTDLIEQLNELLDQKRVRLERKLARGRPAPASWAMRSRKHASDSQTLSGWKQIANYLGLGVRTVQRYERVLRLPIHRPAGKLKSRVFATKAELDRWVKGPLLQFDDRTIEKRERLSD